MPIFEDDRPLHTKLYEEVPWYITEITSIGGGNVISGQNLSAEEIIKLGGGGGGGGSLPLPPSGTVFDPVTGATVPSTGSIVGTVGTIEQLASLGTALALPWFGGSSSPTNAIPQPGAAGDGLSLLILVAGIALAIVFLL